MIAKVMCLCFKTHAFALQIKILTVIHHKNKIREQSRLVKDNPGYANGLRHYLQISNFTKLNIDQKLMA